MAAKLVVELGDQPGRGITLSEGAPVTIGSGQTATWQLAEPDLAQLQLHVELRGGKAHVTPIAPEPATLLNGEQVARSAALADGDVIGVGHTQLRYHDMRARLDSEDGEEVYEDTRPPGSMTDTPASTPTAATRLIQAPSMEEIEKLAAEARNAHQFNDRSALIEGMTGTVTGRKIALSERDEWLLGRGEESDLQVDDGAASRRHCKLSWQRETLWLEDVGSSNGTTINGKRVVTPTPLEPSDMIGIGMTILRVDEG